MFCGAPRAYGSGGRSGVQELRQVLRDIGFPQQPSLGEDCTVVVLGKRCFCLLTRHEEGMILWNLRTRPDSRRLGLASACVGVACGLMPSLRTILAVEFAVPAKEQDRLEAFYGRLGFVRAAPPRGFDAVAPTGGEMRWMRRPSAIELALASLVVRLQAQHQTPVALDEGATDSVDEPSGRMGGVDSPRAEVREVLGGEASELEADAAG